MFFFTKCMNHPTADYSAQIKETKKGQLGQKTRLVAGATGSWISMPSFRSKSLSLTQQRICWLKRPSMLLFMLSRHQGGGVGVWNLPRLVFFRCRTLAATGRGKRKAGTFKKGGRENVCNKRERERREYQACADISSKMNQNKMTPLFEIGLMENPFSYLLSFPLNDSLCSHSQGEKTRYLQGWIFLLLMTEPQKLRLPQLLNAITDSWICVL